MTPSRPRLDAAARSAVDIDSFDEEELFADDDEAMLEDLYDADDLFYDEAFADDDDPLSDAAIFLPLRRDAPSRG